jgi:hypothetical protein
MTSTTYYPEMGGKADGGALFQSYHVIGDTMALRWKPEGHERALAAFKRLRVRPRRMELSTERRNGPKWCACCTHDAFRKLYDAGLVCHEMLLD